MSDSAPTEGSSQDMIMDLFYYDNDAWSSASDKNTYFRDTVKKLCPGSPTEENKEKFYLNKVGYLIMNHDNGSFSVKTVSSNFAENINGVDFSESDDPPTISTIDTSDATKFGQKGSDCSRMP